MKNYIKIIIIYLSQIFLRIFFIFPIKKNRIFFSSFDGKNYDCNPKYIFEYMIREWGDNYAYVWCINDKTKIPRNQKIICVSYHSLLYFFYLFTSKVIISNLGREASLPKRNQQILINTWHGGGAYKKCANEIAKKSKSRLLFVKSTWKQRANNTDFIISSCKMQDKAFNVDFYLNNSKFLKTGMPRNDIFFRITPIQIQKIKENICAKYKINENKKLILYAPTQRRNTSGVLITNKFNIDIEKICKAVNERFGGESILLYRYHIGTQGITFNHAIDVSNYPDMQELLLIADILITDYSSSIWDYSFTYKPGFLYTPDLEQYIKETNFHTPIELWPYPYAETIDKLCNEILQYDEKSAHKKIQKHHLSLESYEKGNAAEKVCQIIQNIIN